MTPWGFTVGDLVRQATKPHTINLGLGMVTSTTPTRVVIQFRPECREKNMKPGSITRTGLQIEPGPNHRTFYTTRTDAGGKIGGSFQSALSALLFMRNDSGKEDSKV